MPREAKRASRVPKRGLRSQVDAKMVPRKQQEAQKEGSRKRLARKAKSKQTNTQGQARAGEEGEQKHTNKRTHMKTSSSFFHSRLFLFQLVKATLYRSSVGSVFPFFGQNGLLEVPRRRLEDSK